MERHNPETVRELVEAQQVKEDLGKFLIGAFDQEREGKELIVEPPDDEGPQAA